MDFTPFPKIPRLMRDIVVTEKLDGTNAQVNIRLAADTGYDFDPVFDHKIDYRDLGLAYLRAGSRNRWISRLDDNYAFAEWVWKSHEELGGLGVGAHFGEWWGYGIGRGYGLNAHDRRWSLFNTARWNTENAPDCCDVVPVLYAGMFDGASIGSTLTKLWESGSAAAPGFLRPEGIIVYHTAANQMFKRMLEKDHAPKGRSTP